MQQPLQQGQNLEFVKDPYRATEVQFQRFVCGVDAVLNQWTALHLVAQHCDAMALQSMYTELITWFQVDGEVFSDDLEIFFENFFSEARSVVIEDDSMKEVGDLLHEMYCRCCQNDFTLVDRYVASLEVYRQVNPVLLSVNLGGNDGDDLGFMENGIAGTAGIATQQGTNGANENEDGDGVQDDERGEIPMITSCPQPKKRRNKKNAYVRDNDGWCVVRH